MAGAYMASTKPTFCTSSWLNLPPWKMAAERWSRTSTRPTEAGKPMKKLSRMPRRSVPRNRSGSLLSRASAGKMAVAMATPNTPSGNS